MKEELFSMNNHKIEVFDYMDSKIYFIENFYKYPRKVKRWIVSHESEYHKKNEVGYNGIHFEDRRHNLHHDGMVKVSDYISKICNQSILSEKNQVITNLFKFKNNSFNNYKENYWHPHKDSGYTAIIYFDDDDTNLYQCLDPTEERKVDEIPEHLEPWKSKDKWTRTAALHGKFNKLILFDGNKFFHGADITKKYIRNFRMNQVVFLKP